MRWNKQLQCCTLVLFIFLFLSVDLFFHGNSFHFLPVLLYHQWSYTCALLLTTAPHSFLGFPLFHVHVLFCGSPAWQAFCFEFHKLFLPLIHLPPSIQSLHLGPPQQRCIGSTSSACKRSLLCQRWLKRSDLPSKVFTPSLIMRADLCRVLV